MKEIVSIASVSKEFGKVQALQDVTFNVHEAELFGLIGPDGAGKSTLFRIVNTLLLPTSGEVTVLGMDAVADYKKIRPRLGYMPGRFSLYQDLSVEENLSFFASVFGTTLEENYALIKPIYQHLERFKDRKAGDLSGGMKQKLALSCALIHKPDLLLLDEPTTGVDALSRKEFWEMLSLLKAEGITMIVSTPYMDEANLCDRVALMQDGHILQVDTPTQIVEDFRRPLLGIKADHTYRLLQALKSYERTATVHPFGEYVHYTEEAGEPKISELEAYLREQGLEKVRIKNIEPNIEDRFMELMDTREQ